MTQIVSDLVPDYIRDLPPYVPENRLRRSSEH